jgi:hypothetical protein
MDGRTARAILRIPPLTLVRPPRTIGFVRLLSATVLLLTSPALFAWTEPAEKRIAQKAAQLAPPDMRMLIDRHAPEYLEGRQDAVAEEQREKHTYSVTRRNGPLKQQIEAEVGKAISTMRTRRPTRDFVYSLGRIAHLVADANHPFYVADSSSRLTAMKPDFEAYLESRMNVIPTIFYGLSSPFKLSTYLDSSLQRAASYYPLLAEEYFPPNAAPRTAANFDDRSTAFGVISVSYSHAVTDLVNIYYYIWKEAGGDVRSAAAMTKGTVLLNPSPESPALSGGFGAPADRQ